MLAKNYMPLAANFDWEGWFLGIGLIVGVLVAAFVVVVIVQRRLDPRRSAPGDAPSDLTTDAIEQMREAGTISQSEYEVMRQIVIGKTMAKTRRASRGEASSASDSPDATSADG